MKAERVINHLAYWDVNCQHRLTVDEADDGEIEVIVFTPEGRIKASMTIDQNHEAHLTQVQELIEQP